MELKKFRGLVDAINSYYGFAILAYAAVLYATHHSDFFFWVFILATPLLAGWTGYLVKSFKDRHTQREGFRVLSEKVTYELGGARHYTFRYTSNIEAAADHLMMYPIGYQWTGRGNEAVPKVVGKGQQLFGVIKDSGSREAAIGPYVLSGSGEEDWHYWFIGLNPPVYKGDRVEIKYVQEFHDAQGAAKPYLYYAVRVPLQKLELAVKFPPRFSPKKVIGSYTKFSDPRHSYVAQDMQYDPDRQWATWSIDHPRKGHYYRIEWQ